MHRQSHLAPLCIILLLALIMTVDSINIYLLTWNVVTSDPPSTEQLEKLFDSNNADFIAIGLQEVKAQPQNVFTDTIYENPWTSSLRYVLAQKDYVKIHTIPLLGIILTLFSKKSHLTSIRNIEASYTKTGLNGLWGNKGAVTIRFNFKGSSICLVNCHLAPHDKAVANRVADYHTVVNGQSFQKDKISKILDHDFVFWLGDLNFRLEPDSFTADEIDDLVKRNQTQLLLARDELNLTISQRKAFQDFSECDIRFNPTYKFIPFTQQYDLKRRPAWTDRILYRTFDPNDTQQSSTEDQVTCKSYQSHPDFILSDHKPVTAHFGIKVKGGDLESVQFDPVKLWVIGTPGYVSYTLPASVEPSTWHWIAFFREQYSSLEEYITYVWSPKQPLAGRKYQVAIPESSLRVPGRYFAAYMSDTQPYHVMGISQVFEVEEEIEMGEEPLEWNNKEL